MGGQAAGESNLLHVFLAICYGLHLSNSPLPVRFTGVKIKTWGHGNCYFLRISQMEKWGHGGLHWEIPPANTWATWIIMETFLGVQSSPCLRILSAWFILSKSLVSAICYVFHLKIQSGHIVLTLQYVGLPSGEQKASKPKTLYRNLENVENTFKNKSMPRKFEKWW